MQKSLYAWLIDKKLHGILLTDMKTQTCATAQPPAIYGSKS